MSELIINGKVYKFEIVDNDPLYTVTVRGGYVFLDFHGAYWSAMDPDSARVMASELLRVAGVIEAREDGLEGEG